MHARAETKNITILALGDSLTAGYGLMQKDAYPWLLEQKLKQEGYNARVINAGVSGDTTGDGLARLDWVLHENPDIAIVELGANDGLRGLSSAQAKANLDAILTELKKRKVRVLLTAVYAPPNMGAAYGKEFDAMFPELVEKHQTDFFPFFLQDVYGKAELNQMDGIHPNGEGTKIIVKNIYPYVKKLVDEVKATN